MKKSDVIKMILGDFYHSTHHLEKVEVYAPTNIALCKYWGKRDQALNLPVTSSLSIALPELGATTLLTRGEREDSIFLNDEIVSSSSAFYQRLITFVDLFRPHGFYFNFNIRSNVPIAAGLASSACGFASIVKALNDFFQWSLSSQQLSILARLGSGSACRSLWNGFVEWHAGVREDGMDSYAEPLLVDWPEFRVGLCLIDQNEKPVSSRVAMQRTVETSVLYQSWPEKVTHDLADIKHALHTKDFDLLGKTAESNALAMHATMLSAWPPIQYCLPETISLMQKIWKLRAEGLPVYFTQDAGPNLKILFLAKDEKEVSRLLSYLSCPAKWGAVMPATTQW